MTPRMIRGLGRLLRAGACALALASGVRGTAAADPSLEYAVKGTYLYKFIPFIDWPQGTFPTPASAVTICIFGQDPFGLALDRAVAGAGVDTRPIVIRRLATLDEIDQCQEIFAGRADPQTLSDLLRAAGGKPILTVTDSGVPPQYRGIISFVIDADHVRFDIDSAQAARSNLGISSKLLGLAHAVKIGSGPP